ncbi:MULTISPECIES: FadR/GntR family transcriptional regulator [unclassified Bradyrhizobium]|uniref:FadR/GntR family transcriptional regulator n=1 Tax=unclassified Bradyrhizobium TaxID=2631580 RepID=UPI000409398D|nr:MULTISPECIES: FadR/GntR family transcriptional regulator [unclassified Bradyrhizobium]MCP3464139.1 FadR family transcriptional regulator [Bradyrhizobium sp. CCGUVB23]
MPLEAVEARRLYRQVADQLRALIDSGEYAVGSRLPTERELAEQLRVSRPTVREALIALEVEGRVRIRVGSGIYVIELASPATSVPATLIEGPFELLRAREFLEGAIAEQAARVATKDDLARIDASLIAMENVEHPGEASMVHDRAFHVAIAGSLGNAVLVRVVGELFDQRLNPYFSQLAHYFESPRTWRAALDEHRVVRNAIAARNPEAARDAMRDHLARSQERFARNFGAEAGGAPASARSGAARSAARPSKPKRPPKKQAASSGARRR